jgi:hypothetical protein
MVSHDQLPRPLAHEGLSLECPAWNALFGDFSTENNVSHLDGSGFNEKHDYVEVTHPSNRHE